MQNNDKSSYHHLLLLDELEMIAIVNWNAYAMINQGTQR
jgi:hypothetical protein